VPVPIPFSVDDQSEETDPATHEVIRHRLFSITEEVASTVYATSGSPVVAHGGDYNSALLTSLGEYIYFGQHILIHAGVIDLGVRYILENFVDSPGINDGDAFVLNDPWIASGHYNDVSCLMPVFADGELAFWVGDVVHHVDLGGVGEGGRDLLASSAWEESTIIPPVKIVSGGQLQIDVTRLIERQSRLGPYTALDLRAQIAGCIAGARRLGELASEFGAGTTIAVADSLIREGSWALQRRLNALPDGEWRARAFVDGAREGDQNVYRVGMRLTKEGDKLTFCDDQSSPQQEGPINATFAGWRSGIVCALMAQLGIDAPFVTGGLLRHAEFVYTPGTLMNAKFPAPVNRGTSFGVPYGALLAERLISHMLVCNPEQRRLISAVSGADPIVSVGLNGKKLGGAPFLRVFIDSVGGGSGAVIGHDGDDTGGSPVNLGARLPNVEDNELTGTYLYLYRREEQNTAGPGTWRGGLAVSWAIVSWEIEEMGVNIGGCAVAFPATSGLFGGYPHGARYTKVIRDSNIWQLVEAGSWPSSPEELEGTRELAGSKVQYLPLEKSDVLVVVAGGGAGIGDPLDRSTREVLQDLSSGTISPEVAYTIYGLNDRTSEEGDRTGLRMERLGGKPLLQTSLLPGDVTDVGPHPYVCCALDSYRCRECYSELGQLDGWYLDKADRRSRPLVDLGMGFSDQNLVSDGTVALAEYSCPGCGRLLEVDISPNDEAMPVCRVYWSGRE
jgi:N-methylhydantoinase B